MITANCLSGIAGVEHGFFNRRGGCSTGLYSSLNTGLGSGDDRASVTRNRQIVLDSFDADRLVTPYQVHSSEAVVVTDPWDNELPDTVPRADGVVTATAGLVIGIQTADCTPVLFSSEDGKVIGAAHAGWKGALNGVLEATLACMRNLGGSQIVAAIGPTISQANYEVGPEFYERFMGDSASNGQFFVPATRLGHAMFDLPGFVRSRLEGAGVRIVEDVGLCTYSDEAQFFSYRRATHRQESDYGRQISAISIRR